MVLPAGMTPGEGIGDIAGTLFRQFRLMVATGEGVPEAGAGLVEGCGTGIDVGIVTLAPTASGAAPQPASTTASRAPAAPTLARLAAGTRPAARRPRQPVRITLSAFLPTSTPRPAEPSPGRRRRRPAARAVPRPSPPRRAWPSRCLPDRCSSPTPGR